MFPISRIIAGVASFRINFHYTINANTFFGAHLCLSRSPSLFVPIMKRNKFRHHFEGSNFKKLAHTFIIWRREKQKAELQITIRDNSSHRLINRYDILSSHSPTK